MEMAYGAAACASFVKSVANSTRRNWPRLGNPFSYGRTNRENRYTGLPEDFFRYGTKQQLHSAGASMRTQNHHVNLTLVQCLLDWRPNRLGPDKHGLLRHSNELRHRSM